MPELDLIVPVYNEKENIGRFIEEMVAKIRTPYEALFVYDYDEDNTLPAIHGMKHRLPMRTVKNEYGQGVLNALKTGFAAATGEFVIVTMADCSDDLGDVDLMVATAREGYDVVAGSRYMKGGQQIGGPFLKRLMSRTAGLSLHYLSGFPVHDITNNFRLYRQSMLENLIIESSGGFELALELTVKAYRAGYRITEIPTTWRDRTTGKSRFKITGWLPHYLKWYLYALKT